jgi:hypothetical protein
MVGDANSYTNGRRASLLIVQKIDAIKTFALPTLDFAMLNGDVGET